MELTLFYFKDILNGAAEYVAEFRHESLNISGNENRVLHSHFPGVQSNFEAMGNVFNHFWYPSIILNRNILKIQIKIFSPKNWKKGKGYP